MFIPVWSGVYEWLRFGVDGRAFRSDTGPQPSAAADDPNLRVIGFVKAISPEAYRIGAGNAAVCPGGEPARHLHLEARNGDTTMHPLADVTIDLGATRFCSVRFILPIRGGRGFSELHFGMVDGYWMTKSDDVESHAGLGSHRSELHIRYDDIRFPTTLDDALFTLTGK